MFLSIRCLAEQRANRLRPLSIQAPSKKRRKCSSLAKNFVHVMAIDTRRDFADQSALRPGTFCDIDPHYLKKTSAHQLLSIRMQMGVSHMWGGLSPQWHLLKHYLWNLGPGYLVGRLEELLILNRPCRPGEDVHDSVLPPSHWQAWKTWENTKKELPKLGLSGLSMRTQWCSTSWRSSVGMRSPWMSHTKKPENTITLKKAELPKDEEEMAHHHKHQW